MPGLLPLPAAVISLVVIAVVWLLWTVRNERSAQPLTFDPGDSPPAVPLLLAVLLLFGGCFFTMPTLLWISATALAMSGFICGFGMRKANVLDGRFNAVFIPVMFILCAIATYGCFVSFSLLTIFGLAIAFATGQLGGMILRSLLRLRSTG